MTCPNLFPLFLLFLGNLFFSLCCIIIFPWRRQPPFLFAKHAWKFRHVSWKVDVLACFISTEQGRAYNIFIITILSGSSRSISYASHEKSVDCGHLRSTSVYIITYMWRQCCAYIYTIHSAFLYRLCVIQVKVPFSRKGHSSSHPFHFPFFFAGNLQNSSSSSRAFYYVSVPAAQL